MNKAWRAIVIFLILAAVTAANAQTIFLVRHAEKTTEKNDPQLTEAGKARAECLVNTLRDAGVQTIFVSDTARSRQTAEPLAKELRLEVTTVPGRDTAALVEKVRAVKNGNELVVGHSNTIPEIIERLGAGKIAPIGDNDFDQLFIVELGDTPHVSVLHYCTALPKPTGNKM